MIITSLLPSRVCERQRDVDRDNERGDEDENDNSTGKWPHALSPALACLGCTLGLFNISRFAILSIQFGGKNKINFNEINSLFLFYLKIQISSQQILLYSSCC